MASTFVNCASYGAASVDSGTCNKPASVAQNDLLLAVVMIQNASSYVIDAVPSGWTEQGSLTANADKYYLYSKVAGASEPSSYTWETSGAGRMRIVIAAYRGGFNTSAPIDAVSNTSYRTNNSSVQAAAMTVSAASSTLIFFPCVYRVSTSTLNFAAPTSQDNDWQEDYDAGETDSDFQSAIYSCEWSGSGDSGTITAVFGAPTNTNTKHAFAVALNPASGGSETKTVTDTGAGSDALGSLAVSLSLADTGSGAEGFASLAAALGMAETGSGADSLANLAAALTVTDTGAGSEAISATVSLTISDVGNGADALNVITAILIAIAETGSGAEGLSIAAAFTLGDSGAGSDAPGVTVALAVTDSGAGADALSVLAATLISIVETAAGSDGIGAISASLSVPDLATAAEVISQIAARLSVADLAAGVETVIRTTPGGVVLATMRFTLAQREARYTLRTRSATHSLTQRRAEYILN